MTVDVYELRLSDAPGEIWYGVRANGTDLRAGWADPDAARRAGERHLREERDRIARNRRSARGGTRMETVTPETPEEPTLPEPEETPAVPEPAPEPETEGDDDGDENDGDEAED